tara:strand:+ start:117 stop:302 length:186 start_codon:yes stop_codon:yes gene_type:complete
MDNFTAIMIAEGFGEGEGATREQQVEAWQRLHDSGLAYQLQGFFGRTAQDLIQQNIIVDKR